MDNKLYSCIQRYFTVFPIDQICLRKDEGVTLESLIERKSRYSRQKNNSKTKLFPAKGHYHLINRPYCSKSNGSMKNYLISFRGAESE